MRIADIIRILKDPIGCMELHNLHRNDVDRLRIFDDYEAMVANGDKVTYVIQSLADKYHTSYRNVFRIIKRMKREV